MLDFKSILHCKCKKCGKVMMVYEGDYRDEEEDMYIEIWEPLKKWERIVDICNNCTFKMN